MVLAKYRGGVGLLRTLIAISMALCVTLVVTQTAFAADVSETPTERITLSPSSTTYELDAGETQRGSMRVINDGDVAYNFSVYARPYSVANEQYEPNFTTQQANTDVYKWVQFDQTTYRIEPGQTIEVAYTLRVPADAPPGGHYGVLFAETDERQLDSTGVARKKRVGNLLYVTVNGEYKTSGELKEFMLPFWQTTAPLISSARVVNSGNADFEAKVTTTVKGLFGGTKFSYTGDPIILPDTTRLIAMNWEAAPNFGLFHVTQTVAFLDQTHQNNGYVLIAPKWAPIVLIIIVVVGAAYVLLRRRDARR